MSYLILMLYVIAIRGGVALLVEKSNSKSSFYIGAIYYLIALIIIAGFGFLSSSNNHLEAPILAVLFIPFIEEILRSVLVFRENERGLHDMARAGFGWGLIEAIVKLSDIEANGSFQHLWTVSFEDIVYLGYISSTILLHIGLTVLLFTFTFKNQHKILGILGISLVFLIHAGHNYLAFHYVANHYVMLSLTSFKILFVIGVVRYSVKNSTSFAP